MTRPHQPTFGAHPPPYNILGPVPCQGCQTLVYWARGVTRLSWNGPQVRGSAWWRERTGRIHRCKDGRRVERSGYGPRKVAA